MSLDKVIHKVDYSGYDGRLVGVRAAIPWAVVGNRFASGGGGRWRRRGRVWVADGSWSDAHAHHYQLPTNFSACVWWRGVVLYTAVWYAIDFAKGGNR